MNNDENQNNNNLNSQFLGNVNNNSNESNDIETLDFLDTSNTNNQQLSSLNNEMVQSSAINVEPAYTNPQTITPMPGFENSSVIGTTPPVSLENENQPKKKNKNNKTLFVIIIIIVLFGIGFGTYYILKYTDILAKKPKVEITMKNVEVNIGDSLSTDINVYASVNGTDIKNCVLKNITDVDTSSEGNYSIMVSCGEVSKSGVVKVVDNRELSVVTKKVYKVKGETIDVKEFIVDENDEYTYEFVDKEKVEGYLNGEFGNHVVKIKVTNGAKIKEVETELYVLEHGIRGYLLCKSKEQNLKDSSTKKQEEQRLSIANDENNSFGNVASVVYTFKFADETEYANYLAKYKTDGVITIDNISGNTKFDDENLTIVINNDRNSEEVINEYGNNNMRNYGTMRAYFEKTLGYSCTYKVGNVE